MGKVISAGSALALVLAVATLCPPLSAQTAAPVLKKGIVAQGGREAIGPKQDDPRAMGESGCDEGGSIQPATGSNDPAAKQGIIVQGGLEAIGPKQDDPRAAAPNATATRAIGPKQDDPRALATACQRRKAKS